MHYAELAEKLLRVGSLSPEKIADVADLPLSQVQQIAQKLALPVQA